MFRNTQWRVTRYGLESVTPVAPYDYAIEAERLTDEDGEGGYEWPAHMARKGWVDVDAFIAAYMHALETHKARLSPHVDLARLERSLARARAIDGEARLRRLMLRRAQRLAARAAARSPAGEAGGRKVVRLFETVT